MEIQLMIDLSGYSVKDLIKLHRDGIITIGEIMETRRHITAFGPELNDYIMAVLDNYNKGLELLLGDTQISN